MTTHKNPTATNKKTMLRSCLFERIKSWCQKNMSCFSAVHLTVDFIFFWSGIQFQFHSQCSLKWNSRRKSVSFICYKAGLLHLLLPSTTVCDHCPVDKVFTSRRWRGYDWVVVGSPVPSTVPKTLGLQCAQNCSDGSVSLFLSTPSSPNIMGLSQLFALTYSLLAHKRHVTGEGIWSSKVESCLWP